MGVYVKGIKMPTRCHECHFNVAGWCYATDRIDNRTSFVTDYPIQPWCPLGPVPPHGRLGDLDELLDRAFGCLDEETFLVFQFLVNGSAVIIPANKEN